MATSRVTTRDSDLPGRDLLDVDCEMLEKSWIDRDLALCAGLRRVSDIEGAALLGRKKVKHLAGILFPFFFPGERYPREFRIRVDSPEMEMVAGNKIKPKYKYLSPQQARPLLYFPPTVDPVDLDRTELPIIITEGEKKTLALARLATFQQDSNQPPRWLAIGIPGVWNWRGTVEIAINAKGERVPVKGPIPDLNRIAWKNRTVYILFDANVRTKPEVFQARRHLAAELLTRKATVILIDLPQHDGVNGIDDYIYQFGPEAALRLIQQSTAPEKVGGFTVEESGENWGVRYISRTPAKDESGRAVRDENGKLVMEDQSIFVCSPLHVEAQTRDSMSRSWGRWLTWTDNDNVTHHWAMPMSALAGEGAELRSRLLHEGLIIGANNAVKRGPRELLQAYLLTARPQRRLLCVSKTGWHDKRFVLPDLTIAAIDAEQVVYQTRDTAHHDYRMLGTLADWQSGVSALCENNTRLELGLAAAFAACFLGPLGDESGGFHFRGSSSSGKTTLLLAAGSVWGGGERNGFVKTWKATASGIEGTALRHNDTLLPLDELSQVAAEDAGDIAYQSANGQAKIRANKVCDLRDTPIWNVLFLSTGELSLDQHMQAANRKARGGQMVRLIEIPADAGKEMGVFEDLHSREDGAAFAKELSANATRWYGTASRAFLQRVATDSEIACRFVREQQSAFVRSQVPEAATGEVYRAAQRFGLVAAAGELGTLLNITGWHQGRSTEAARVCFEIWMSKRGTLGSFDEKVALDHVRAIIQTHDARFQRTEHEIVPNRLGWYLNGEYLFYPESFNEACAQARIGVDVALEALSKAGLLKRGDGKHKRPRRSLPGGTRPRFFVIDERIITNAGEEDGER